MRIGAALLPVLLAAACAQKQWVDEKTGSAEGARAALAQCRAAVEKDARRDEALHPGPDIGGPRAEIRNPVRLRIGSQGRVYTKPVDLCMREKGYALVEANTVKDK